MYYRATSAVFSILIINFINHLVIIGNCAFTAYLLLSNLPWYIPQLANDGKLTGSFYLIVLAVISTSVYSSTDIRYVRLLSLGSTWLFFVLIAILWSGAMVSTPEVAQELMSTFTLLGGYFANLEQFILPLNDYHEFYLYWWFAWSIMIGQFTSRFIGGIRTYQLLLAMLVFPSIPIAIWFVGLFYYHQSELTIPTFITVLMIIVGILFVINSLDSLIRLYTDNLKLTVKSLGKLHYILANILILASLTLLFTLDFLQIQWVGAIVIGIMFSCFLYIMFKRLKNVLNIRSSPEENI